MESKEKYRSYRTKPRVINRANKQNITSLFATRVPRRSLSFSHRAKRKLNYPVPIVSMKIRPPAERKERRGGIYISLDAKIFALYRDHDGGGENFKKGRRSAKIQRPCREHTVWNISRALAYWDASGVKLYLAQVVSLRLGNPRVSSRGVTPSVCQFESFANRVRQKIVLSSYL